MDSENQIQENKNTEANQDIKEMEIDEETNDNLDKDLKSSKFLKRGRIFIRNLPFSVTEDKIRTLFSKFGEIKELNLPYDNTKKMFKGFCFLQYETKKEALFAIKELNGKILDKRKLDITIAQPKNEYSGLPKIENEAEKFNKNKKFSKDENSDKGKSRSLSTTNDEAKTIEKHTRNAAQSGNDPSRTLFIRNLGFNTTEDVLQTLFSKYGKLKYCLICRNKETNASKGSGFVMFENSEDIENVLRIYEKYESNKEYSGLNPFELEGRNLKIFRSVSKDEAVRTKEAKKNEDSGDNRNRELLYFGLNNYYDFAGQEAEVSEEDKQKREMIIQQKKTNFKKNPNLHVSETRLVLRNIDKAFNESKIKELLREKTEQFMEDLKIKKSSDYKVYMKLKKIKQIKLIRDEKVLDKDNNPKSKSVAYIEVCDTNFAKWLIKSLSNLKVSKNPNKGLIMDFVLDDIRKIRNRLIKHDRLKSNKKAVQPEEGKSKMKERNDKRDKADQKAEEENTSDLELKEDNEKADPKKVNVLSIDTITDVNKLVEIYDKTISRGKKQRIKKRIIALGHSVSVLGKPKELNFGQIDKKMIINKNSFFNKSEANDGKEERNEVDIETKKIQEQKEFLKNLAKGISSKNAETYTVVRVDNDNMNINKKIKEEMKKTKSKNKNEESENLSGKKRGRDNSSVSKDKNKKFETNYTNNKNKNNKDDDTYNNNKGKNKNANNRGREKSRKNDINEDDDDMGGFEMSHYINKIEENLRNNK